jgi:hypothetical protein
MAQRQLEGHSDDRHEQKDTRRAPRENLTLDGAKV